MKTAPFIIAIGGVVVLAVIARKYLDSAARKGATGGKQAPVLTSSATDAITEAAYNQDANDFAAAFGADENTSGEEVTSIQ